MINPDTGTTPQPDQGKPDNYDQQKFDRGYDDRTFTTNVGTLILDHGHAKGFMANLMEIDIDAVEDLLKSPQDNPQRAELLAKIKSLGGEFVINESGNQTGELSFEASNVVQLLTRDESVVPAAEQHSSNEKCKVLDFILQLVDHIPTNMNVHMYIVQRLIEKDRRPEAIQKIHNVIITPISKYATFFEGMTQVMTSIDLIEAKLLADVTFTKDLEALMEKTIAAQQLFYDLLLQVQSYQLGDAEIDAFVEDWLPRVAAVLAEHQKSQFYTKK